MQLSQFQPPRKVLVVAGSLVATYTLSSLLLTFYFKHKRNQLRKSYPKDTVILHQFPRKNDMPTLATPCLKLETWLRMTDIKYENEFSNFDKRYM